jgi:hypothetical protein
MWRDFLPRPDQIRLIEVAVHRMMARSAWSLRTRKQRGDAFPVEAAELRDDLFVRAAIK